MANKFNRVVLNLPAYSSSEQPEPGLPAVTIDGTSIDNVQGITVRAAAGEYTTVTMSFIGEVGGFVGQDNIGEEIERIRREK